MKHFISLIAVATLSFSALTGHAQDDKAKRPSPPAKVSATTSKGVTVTIDYSQPSVKSRTIGKDIAPYGQVWRTGANEATTFELSKDAAVGGKKLSAGKYGLYTIPGEKEWTIILNKKADLWGSDGYSEAEDAARFTVSPSKAPAFMEKMTFAISDAGKVSLTWGDVLVSFNVD